MRKHLVPSSRGLAAVCAVIAWCVSAVGLAGIVLDLRVLEAYLPDAPGIRVSTCVALALLAVALWLERGSGRPRRLTGLVAASVAGAIAAIAFVDGVFGVDLDVPGFSSSSSIDGAGTMSPQSALGLLVLALAFVVAHRWPYVSQGLAVAALTVAAAAVIAVSLGIRSLLGMPGVEATSLPGGIAIGVLAIGLVALDTDVGLGRLFAAPTRGGRLARRGLAVAVLASVTFGIAVFVIHEEFGLVQADVAVSLYLLGSLVIAAGLVPALAFSLDRLDRARAAAVHDLVASEALTRSLIEHAPEAIVVIDVERGRFVRVNGEAERLFGLPAHELLRRGLLDVSAPLQEGGTASERAFAEQLDRTLAGAAPVFDWLIRTPAGRSVDAEVRLLRLPGQDRTLVRGSIIDVGARKRAEVALRAVESERAARAAAETDRDRIAALQRITARLLAAPSVDDVAAAFVQQVVPDLGAVTGLIFTLEGTTLLRRGHTDDAADPGWSTVGLDAPTTSAAAARSGSPVIVAGIEGAQAAGFPLLADAMQEFGYAAFASFPLYAGDVLVGVGSFGFPRNQSDEHWEFLGRVADRLGMALERARLFEAERDLRRQLEYAAERAAAMQRVTQALARAVTADEVVDLTATLGIEALGACAATAGVLDADANEYAVRTYGFPRGSEPWHSRIAADRDLPGPESVRTQHPLWFASSAEVVEAFPEARDFFERSELGASACVPLIAWGRPLGFLAAHYAGDREFTEVDRVVFTTLASVSAQALDRARRFESERETASVLQQSMLPSGLPDLPTMAIAARYSSAGDLEVGGDWYDATALDDGSVIFAVGDVVGRGLAAAAAMGQLRSAIKALALSIPRPREVLARLDEFAATVDGAGLATVAIARLDPSTATLEYASAGHVPSVIVHPDGSSRLLTPRRALPLDARPEPDREELEVPFPHGSTLILYTDGLIERRGESLDAGLRRLTRSAESLNRLDVDAMCEHLVSALLPQREQQRDDVAVLCVRLLSQRASLRRRFPASPGALAPLRGEVRAWLAGNGLSARRSADLVLAVDEACANAVEHAYAADEAGDIVVELALDGDDQVVVRVHDAGQWREGPPRPERGRGLGIIRSVVDECELETGAGGTTVLLRQRITPT